MLKAVFDAKQTAIATKQKEPVDNESSDNILYNPGGF